MARPREEVVTSLVAACAVLLAACGAGSDEPTLGTGAPAPDATPTTIPSAPTTARPPSTASTTTAPAVTASVEPVDPARLHASWRPGCPVAPDDLRLLTLPYRGFDGGIHTGELVVHADVADDVASVFGTLFEAGFPIARMELVDVYGGDDDASTAANNTSAFNCRPVTGGERWSEHSFGRAVDLNPVQNPYVSRDGSVVDPAAAPYLDRTLDEPGMIHPGDVVVQAFASIGWEWGGDFRSIKDYQHFSRSGR